MCTSPIKIKNRSRRYRDGLDKMFFTVPCGHCKDCLKREQDDWFVRAFFEFRRIQRIGGHVFFPTFTYNDVNLPIWNDERYNFRIPCFSYHHIKSWRDKFRVYLKRCGFDSDGMRFIIVPEFGGKKGRPHYHALIFCPFDISIRKILELLRKSWSFGFVGVSRKGLEINSVNGIQYCMKYVSKEQHWTKYYNIDKYKFYLKRDIINDVPDAKSIYSEFRKVLPRHYQSTKFGSDLIDILYTDNDSLINGKIDLSKYGFLTKNKFTFSIPRYIERAILKWRDTFGTDCSSFKADEIFVDKFINVIAHDVQSLSYCQSYDIFVEHFKPLCLPKSSIDIAWDCISPIKDKLPQLVVYNSVYKDVPLIERPIDSLDFYMEHSLNFAYQQNFHFEIPKEKGFSAYETDPDLFNENRFTYGDLPCFRGFDDALKVLYDLNRLMSQTSNDFWLLSDEVSVNQYYTNTYEFFSSIV